MQAARLNALDLLASAETLYQQGHFQHSTALSILAIEEIGKLPLLQAIFLAEPLERKALWRSYRQHRSKTERLPIAIESRIRITFPEIDAETAKQIADDGPTPTDLDLQKQLALYSDFLENDGETICHLPRNVDWQQQALNRMWEAKATIEEMRDRTPDELGVWLRHRKNPDNAGKSLKDLLPAIHEDLVAKGYIEEKAWKHIFQALAEECGDA